MKEFNLKVVATVVDPENHIFIAKGRGSQATVVDLGRRVVFNDSDFHQIVAHPPSSVPQPYCCGSFGKRNVQVWVEPKLRALFSGVDEESRDLSLHSGIEIKPGDTITLSGIKLRVQRSLR